MYYAFELYILYSLLYVGYFHILLPDWMACTHKNVWMIDIAANSERLFYILYSSRPGYNALFF